jgi:hypothetical protein
MDKTTKGLIRISLISGLIGLKIVELDFVGLRLVELEFVRLK